MDFLKIKTVELPFACVQKAYDHIRYAGAQNLEGVVLFSGIYVQDNFIFSIKQTIVPQQVSVSLEEGLLYAVGGEELYRINYELHQRKEILVAQLHSHPGRAYHSSTDDAYPIITKIGGLSIVVPNFGVDDFSLDLWAVYRLEENLEWEELSQNQVYNLIKIID